MEATHPACTLHSQNVKFPFPIASDVLKECSPGGLPGFCIAIWGSILGGAHELEQQRIPTRKHFRHFNFYYNLNYVSTALRKRKTWWPNLFFPFNDSINLFFQLQTIRRHLACTHIYDVQGTGDQDSLSPTLCISNLMMSHFSYFRELAWGFSAASVCSKTCLPGKEKTLYLACWEADLKKRGNCYNYSENFCMQIQFSLGEICILYKESPCQK